MLFGLWYYWKHFPAVLDSEGLPGIVDMFGYQFIISAVGLYIYDCFDTDVFGLVSAKAQVRSAVDRARARLGLKPRGEHRSWFTAAVELLICSIKFYPFVSMLIYREQGQREKWLKEMMKLAIGTTITTLWWTGYSLAFNGVIRVSSPFIKWIFNLH